MSSRLKVGLALFFLFSTLTATDVLAAVGAASIAARTVRITGGGFTPGEPVDVVLEPGPSTDVVVGTAAANATGGVDLSLSRVNSLGAAAAGATALGLRGSISGTFVSFAPAIDPVPSFWQWLFSQNNPPTQDSSSIRNTELAAAGFNVQSISIVDVSANISLLAQQNRFDFATDTIFSDISFQALGLGPVFATYDLTGVFNNLADPTDLTMILPPVNDSFRFSEQIGSVIAIPEPSTALLIPVGFLLLWASRRKRHA